LSPDPLVSVIIPTYNRYHLLSDAAASVLAQTFAAFELIIVDDGSTDETWERLGEFSDKRISRIRIEHTGLPGLVRNRGVASARGEYIAFLDSDDLWLPEKLMLQYDFMRENPGCRISHTRERWIRGGKEISQAGQRHRRSGIIFGDALKKCIIGPSTVMMEKKLFEAVGGFREDLEIAEDYEMWLRITACCEVGYIDKPLTVKQAGHEGQLSEKYGHIEYFRIQGLKSLVDANWFPEAFSTAAREELSSKCAIYAAGCRKRDKVLEAEEFEKLAETYRA